MSTGGRDVGGRDVEIYAARYVLPVSGPEIPRGAVLVEDGRITAVGPLSEVGDANPGVEVRYFPHHAIIPGAVNTHAHLGFRRGDQPEGGTFGGWLEGLVERLPEKESWTSEAARESAREAIEAGTTYMAESSPYGECLPQLAESGMAGAVYAEFFPHEVGESPEEVAEFIAGKVVSLREGLPPRVGAYISVHAPYTVDPESARLAARKSREPALGNRLAIHLSESPEEVEFVREGSGPLARIFSSADWGGRGVSPVRYGEEVELLGPGTIAAHLATDVSGDDLEILRQTGTAAAHCPRSNAFLGCGVSPVPEMLSRGVRVGMGTDGLWSSPSLNLFEETLFAVKLHGFSGAQGLSLATLGGAEALGLGREIGSLEPGKRADLAVVEVESGGDLEQEVLESAAAGGVGVTVAGGRVVYNRIEA